MAQIVSLEARRAERAQRTMQSRKRRIALGLAQIATEYARLLDSEDAGKTAVLAMMREAVDVLAL